MVAVMTIDSLTLPGIDRSIIASMFAMCSGSDIRLFIKASCSFLSG